MIERNDVVLDLNHVRHPYVVMLSLTLAIIFGLCSLTGFLTGNAYLSNFGVEFHPVRPLALFGYGALALALGAPLRSKPWAIVALLAIPVLVMCWSAAAALFIPTGDASSAHPHGPAPILAALFQQPYLATLVVLAILTLAVAMVRGRGGFDPVVAALASVALGVSLISGVVILTDIVPPGNEAKRVVSSLPTAAQAIAIAIAVLARSGWPAWTAFPGRGTQLGKIMRLAFPVIVLVPAFTGLIEILIEETGAVSPIVVDLVAAGINVAVFATLIFWSIGRIATEQAALLETTEAIESAPIALTTPLGIIRHWSRGCEDLYGWTAEEVVGRNRDEVLQSQRVGSAHALRRVDDTRDEQRELIERRRDGTAVHVIDRVRLVQAEGRPPLLVHKTTDITDRVRVENALANSEANLALALNAQRIGTFELDVATGHIALSGGIEQRLGLEPGDLQTLAGWVERVDPADTAAVFGVIRDAAAEHAENVNYRYRMQVPNGGQRVFEGSGRIIYDAQGVLRTVVGVTIDVTDRNAREAVLAAQQEQFRLVLQTVPSGMMIFDERHIIVAFSASAERMLGYTAEAAIGLDIAALMVEPDSNARYSIVERYLADGKSHVTDGARVLQLRHRDGSAVPVDMWMGDLNVGSQRLFTSFFQDLTDRISTQERLAQMRDELLHVSRLSAMGELVASLTHELNQPLAATSYFLGAADLVLADDANLEQGRSLLRLGAEQTLRAGEIIRRMRGFATRDGADMQAGPISTIIEDAVALAFLGEARYDIDLVYDLDPAAEMILADRVQISQVFFNLLRNATEELRKCPPTGRRIAISTKLLTTEMIEVRVADSGPGFDPLILDQLYVPFVSTKQETGMGVGLSICRRIIEAHGGTLMAENGANGGAVFRFTLSTTSV